MALLTESSLNETRPESEEPAPSTGNIRPISTKRELVERSRVNPVSESDRVVVRSAASHKDNTENDETDDGDDLDGGEPEFGFSVCPRSEEIDGQDENEADRHPYGRMGRLVPIGDDDLGRDDFDWDGLSISCAALVSVRGCTHDSI